MKLLVLLFLPLLALACAPAGHPGDGSDNAMNAPAGGASASAVATSSGQPVPVDGAQWTILADTIRGSTHVGQARRLKDQLIASSGLKQWYLVHADAESTLYHGYYKQIGDDSADAKRAAADLAKVKAMKDSATGSPMFSQAMMVAIASADPQAPPEWNLLNSGGHYTLVIGTYAGNTERKQAAVDVVRDLRAAGVPAFYYHGDASSTVSIGAWPKSAADEGQAVENRDPRKRVIVAAGAPNAQVERAIQRAGEAGAVTLTPSFVPRDPAMIAAMKEYPHLHTNGQVYVRTVKDPASGQTRDAADPSYIAVIPKQTDSVLRQTSGEIDAARQADFGSAVYGQPTQTPPRPRTGQGQLKGIE